MNYLSLFCISLLLCFFQLACARHMASPQAIMDNPSVHPSVQLSADSLVQRVYFDFQSDVLSIKEMDTLRQNLGWMQRHRNVVIILEGHTDEWGSSAFNLALGDRRARFVKSYLVQNGIHYQRLLIISYGESQPLDPAHHPKAWAKNRRVEFMTR